MSTPTLPSVIANLSVGIDSAIATIQNQGKDVLQLGFLNRLQLLTRKSGEISEMITAINTALTPSHNWMISLDFRGLKKIAEDFSLMATQQTFDVAVAKYANLDDQLKPFVFATVSACNQVWKKNRDVILSQIDLNFEKPNEKILKAIDPSVKLPITFNVLQVKLKMQSVRKFDVVWTECDGDSAKFAAYVQDLKNSVQEFIDAVDPIINAMKSANPKVAKFLQDAAQGSATLNQAGDPEVSKWLSQDSTLLDSFVLRFKDEN
jgi:hypothetical protein